MSAGHPTGGEPAPKKTSPWIFVLIGCAGLIVIAGVAMVGLGYFAVNKVKLECFPETVFHMLMPFLNSRFKINEITEWIRFK